MMMRAIRTSALAMLFASGCAGRSDDTNAPEPWVLEAEPTVFADTKPTEAETVLTTEVGSEEVESEEVESEPTARPTPTAEPAASPLEAITGDYRYSGGSAQRKSLATEIDGVANQMSVFARSIAKNRLTKANKVPAHLEIASDGTAVTVFIDGKAYTAPLGGKSVKVTDQGQRSKLRYELRGDSLYMFLVGAEGNRTNVFTPRDDGNGITMRVTVKSPKLPDTIDYRLTYKG